MQDAASPSTANIAMACAIVGGVTGYLIGQAKSLGLFGGSPISDSPLPDKGRDEAAEEDDSEDDETSAPAEFPNNPEECKLVLVVRTDLGMTKGASYSVCLVLDGLC
jgi:PTH2 family peptidyl-tRNA hydrolase